MARAKSRTLTMKSEPLPPPADAARIKCRYDELVPVGKLKPYPKNRNKHSDEQIARLALILKYQGVRAPIVVVKGETTIAKGHGTLEAIKFNGWTHAPVVYQEFDDDEQLYAFVQSDNAIAAWAELDLSGINADIGDLGPDFDLDLLGIKDFVLEPADKYAGDPDDVPEVPKVAKTKRGELWTLGNHRLLIDDCTVRENVERLMGGEKADITLTDPPYGLGDTKSKKNNYESYEDSKENLIRTIDGFFPLAKLVSDVVLITPGNGNQSIYEAPTWTMAWFTPAGVGRGPWGFCCWQPILCYGKDTKLSNGMGCHPDALVHTESSEDFGHPCAKPIGFWCWLMERASKDGDAIYEPFCGSGTSIVAAEKLGRRCFALEIDPIYADVILDRWAKYTGKDPVREDGVKWSKLNA